MGIPARGDPRRPLHLAVRSTRLLGIIFLLIGTLVMLFMIVRGVMSLFRVGPAIVLVLFYVGPGAVYLVTAIYLRRRQFWAVVVGLVMASIHLIFFLLAIAGILIAMLRQPGATVALIPMILVICVSLALAQLIYHLALSFEAIKYAPVEDQHGFEPSMAPPGNPAD